MPVWNSKVFVFTWLQKLLVFFLLLLFSSFLLRRLTVFLLATSKIFSLYFTFSSLTNNVFIISLDGVLIILLEVHNPSRFYYFVFHKFLKIYVIMFSNIASAHSVLSFLGFRLRVRQKMSSCPRILKLFSTFPISFSHHNSIWIMFSDLSYISSTLSSAMSNIYCAH